MARRRKSSGDGVLGILILVGAVAAIKYWPYVVGVGIVCLVFWLASKKTQINKSKQKSIVTSRDLENLEVTISPGGPKSVTYSKSSAPFYLSPQMVKVGKFDLPAHLMYIGKDKSGLPHLINPALPIGSERPSFAAAMGYWPSYHSISADDRATYLAWLASGRNFPTPNIGFVFLYFYGLEYRALVEKENQKEVLEELISLYLKYARLSGSFARYCGGLMNLLIAEGFPAPSNANDLLEHLLDNPKEAPLLKDAGWAFKNSARESDLLAFHFFAHERIAIPAKYRDDLRKVVKAYREQLKSGPKTEFIDCDTYVNYRTASAIGLNINTNVKTPVLSKTSLEFAKSCWSDCLSQFAGYSKMKKWNRGLAEFLAPNNANSMREKLERDLAFDEYKIFDLSELTSKVGMVSDENLTATEAKAFAGGLERLGLSVEPDPRLTGKGLRADEKIIITKRPLAIESGDKWKKALPLFDLAISVAFGDGRQSDSEVSHAIDFVCKHFKLGKTESERLSYRAKLLEESKLGIPAIAKRVASTLTMNQGETIAKFLFSIATLDGKLEKGEITTLEKAFKAFGFQPDTLDRLIVQFSSSGNEPLVVLKSPTGKAARSGSKIPQQPSTIPATLTLDRSALDRAFKEADEVSNLLSAVFVDDAENDEGEKTSAGASASINFTATEQEILNKLVAKDAWSISEVEELCRSFGIMYGAFLTKVNDHFEIISGDIALEEDGELLTISRDCILTGARSA